MTEKKAKVRSTGLIELIRVCKEAGVQSFKNGNIEILFSAPNHETIIKAPDAQLNYQDFQKIEPLTKSKDDELFDLMVANPTAFEEEMQRESGEMND